MTRPSAQPTAHFIAIQSRVLQHKFSSTRLQYRKCIAIQSLPPCSHVLASYHNTPRCIAIQSPACLMPFPACNTRFVLQYNFFPLHSVYCNTMQYPAIQFPSLLISLIAIQFPVLQYNFSSLTSLVAIQILVLQYTYLAKTTLQNYHVIIQCLYCETISMCKWAVAHLFTTLKKKFLVFFSLFIFFHFFFQPLETPKKNIHPLFFFHFSSNIPNNFIKIYFLHFL